MSTRSRGWPAGVVCAVLLSCSSGPPPAPPTGIANLQLPYDAGTLSRMGGEEDAEGTAARRRETLANVSSQLLIPPPADPLVPELFDFLTAMAPRMEAGVISPAWGSYLYTSYEQDLVRERPKGIPRRTRSEIDAALDRYVEFFHLRARSGDTAAHQQSQGFESMREWRDERRLGR